jgi:multiple sugar transport system ATP-binding protein
MSAIHLHNVAKRFGHADVIRNVSMNIADGEFCVLVGPSGSGKSTLLRMIAGLEAASAGRLSIGGRDVTDLPPKARDIAMVFQSYALYPQMTVAENMGFGLKLAGKPKAQIEHRVNGAADILGLKHLLTRKPAALSGGQRQRVAMGRAMVREPSVFLFDEPLSNLDAALRAQVRGEIRDLHRRLATTSVYVTHDQVEAMTMGDRIVVLRDGRVEQAGTPVELYEQPANRFVAGFIGSPAMNFFDAPVVRAPDLPVAAAGGTTLKLPSGCDALTQVTLGLRPEHLEPGDADPATHLGWTATVDSVEFIGAETQLVLDTPVGRLCMTHRGSRPANQGDHIAVRVPKERLHCFDPATGGRMTH